MKKKMRSILIVPFAIITTSLMLTGCSPKENSNDSSPSEPTTVSESISLDNLPEVETKLITITVINLSKTDIGMFSLLDPQLDEQTNLNEIAADGTLSFSCNWPIDVKELNWAVYDTEGSLLLESNTDITDCKDTISLLLSGEDTIDDVDVFFN